MSKDARQVALDHLAAVKAAMHELCPAGSARLDQFDAHLATTAMCVDHLFDEAARAAD
jgi:hypothetical protein